MSEKKLSKEEIIEKLKNINLKDIPGNEKIKSSIERRITAKNTKSEKQLDINEARRQNRESRIRERSIKEIGASFELKGKNNSPVIINSNEEIEVKINYSPTAIRMRIEGNKDKKSAEISISGFGATIYKYERNYSNLDTLTEKDGVVKFEQDISESHDILLKLKKSTYTLYENGWFDSSSNPVNPNILTWNPTTRVATLKQDINDTIEIDTDYVKLDGLKPGNGKYKIDGTTLSLYNGIYFYGRQNITISNIEIVNCSYGIDCENSDYITIKKNVLSNNYLAGIYLWDTRDVSISENLISDNDEGIELDEYNRNAIIENNIISNGDYGIYFEENNNSNKIINNTISKTDNLPYFYGIYMNSDYNNNNLIEKNNINIFNNVTTSNFVDFVGVYFDGSENNYNNILNNSIKIYNNKSSYSGGYFWSYLAGIELYDYDSGKSIIKNNKIAIEDNNLSAIDSYMDNYFYGIILENRYVGAYVVESNNISIKRNNLSNKYMTVYYYMDNNISAIYMGSYSMGSSVKNNNIEIEYNSNATSTMDSGSLLTGIYLENDDDGNTIENNKISIKNNSMINAIEYYGIYLNYDNNGNLIKKNTIVIIKNSETNYYYRDIYSILFDYGNYGNKIRENNISNNQGMGIVLLGNNNGNEIERNKISNNEEVGLELVYGNENNKIAENYINNNQMGGLALWNDNDSNDIIGNEINNNKLAGIYIYYDNDSSRIKDNNILSNENYGLYFGGWNYDSRVECNMIKNNKGYGIYLNNNSTGYYNLGNNFISNTISNNTIGMYITVNNTGNLIKYNNFINKTGTNAHDENAVNINEFYSNYWSDWSGVGPYYVNTYPLGPVDTNPSKSQKNMCYKPTPPVEGKPIKMPYDKCNHRYCNYSSDCCHEYKKC